MSADRPLQDLSLDQIETGIGVANAALQAFTRDVSLIVPELLARAKANRVSVPMGLSDKTELSAALVIDWITSKANEKDVTEIGDSLNEWFDAHSDGLARPPLDHGWPTAFLDVSSYGIGHSRLTVCDALGESFIKTWSAKIPLADLVDDVVKIIETFVIPMRAVFVDEVARGAAALDMLKERGIVGARGLNAAAKAHAELAAIEFWKAPVDTVEPDVGHEVVPVPFPPPPFESAKDRYDEEWEGVGMTYYFDASHSPLEVRDSLRDSNGIVPSGTTMELHGVIEGMWIGGGHKYAISNADGSPLGDLRIVFEDGARVDGFKIGTSKGGMVGELRLVDPILRADDRDVAIQEMFNGNGIADPTGEFVVEKKGNEESVVIEAEEALHDGEPQGDFAPLRVLDHMPDGFHLVCINTRVEVDPSWLGYDGMGIKWAIFLKRCRATFDSIVTDSAREHTFYHNNTADLFVENGLNMARLHTDKLGVTRLLGNGRTWGQVANRVEQVYPAGGPPSSGVVVFKNCEAHRCGWEGMLPVVDKKTGKLKPGSPTGKGGSDFTCHGHTGPYVKVIDCASIDPYCSSIACWSEAVAKMETENNPEGYRCYMIDPAEDIIFDDIYDPLLLAIGTADGWGTHRFIVEGFRVEGVRHAKQRPPFLISGARNVHLEGLTVNGESVVEGSEHLKIEHQSGATPIESLEVIA